MNRLIGILLLASAALHHQPTFGGDIELVYMAGGQEAGFYRQEQLSPGEWKIRSKASDNGRGEDKTVIYRLDDDGYPLIVTASGKSWGGARIDESFSNRNGHAQWKTLTDSGEAHRDQPAYYYPQEATLFDGTHLARLALRAKDGRVSLLPSGEAMVRAAGSIEVNGQRLTMYAIRGLDLSESFIWLDEALDPAAFIQSPTNFLVRRTLLEDVSVLTHHQASYKANAINSRNERFREIAEGMVVFRNVDVFDSRNAVVSKSKDVLVYDGVITAIRATGEQPPEGARIVEGQGAMLLPGLWDSHGHNASGERMFQHMAFGVTSVREIAIDPAGILEVRRKTANGELIGPRLILSGFLEGKSEYSSKSGILADSLESAIEAIDWYADHGFQQLKIYNSVDPDWVEELVAHAHARGLRVGGHVPAFMRASDVVSAGYDEINHINMIFLNFLLHDGDDTRTTLRFTRLGEAAGKLDLKSPEVRQFIAHLKENDVAVDVTLGILKWMIRHDKKTLDHHTQQFIDRLPPIMARMWSTPWLEVSPEHQEAYRRSSEALDAMTLLLHESGVKIVPGTDSGAGYRLHAELASWVHAGIPPAEVLKAATFTAANLYSAGHERGAIEVGKLADLVLVDGDPTSDISSLRHLRLVMQGTSLYDAPAMQREIGINP